MPSLSQVLLGIQTRRQTGIKKYDHIVAAMDGKYLNAMNVGMAGLRGQQQIFLYVFGSFN